jgi:Ca2+-binding RTX toxin-like protein
MSLAMVIHLSRHYVSGPGVSRHRLAPRARRSCHLTAVLSAWLLVLGGVSDLQWPSTAAATSVSRDLLNRGVVVADVSAETNAMTVRAEPGELIFDDTSAVLTTTLPPSQCPVVLAHTIRCLSAGIVTLTARLGGGDDSFRLDDSTSAVAAIANALIDGGAGNDELLAGAGEQDVFGGAGNDIVFGGAGSDDLRGGAGNDRLSGGEGPDTVYGEEDDDELDGGGGDDDVRGGDGADVVGGGDGADRLDDPVTVADEPTAGGGPDTVTGGPGDDTLGGGSEAGAAERDFFSGGDGLDTMDYAARVSPLIVSLDAGANDGAPGEGDNVQPDIERVVGGSDSDTLIGSDGANTLDGGPGDDFLSGRGGDDSLQGGVNDSGGDRLVGGAGTDVLNGGAGDDELEGGEGDDALFGEGGTDSLAGEGGQDKLEGGTGLDALEGGDGNDTLNGGGVDLVGADGADELNGGAGDDALRGGRGNDRLDGGPGGDRISGEDGRDTVSYENRDSPVTVTFNGIADDGEPGEKDNVASDVEIVLGGPVADTLVGDARPNVLNAGKGEDYVIGGAGPDALEGGPGIDVMRSRDNSRDVVSCGEGIDLAIVDRRDAVRGCNYVDRGVRRRPALGRAARAEPAGGKVNFRLRGAHRFFRLREAVEVPIGSTLDAHKGTVSVVTTKRRGGGVQEGQFRGGAFTVLQRKVARPVTQLRLTGGRFASCRGSAAGRASVRRRLWARIAQKRRGKTQVRGKHSIGGSFGTTWLTEDRCDGTLTRVLSGTVRVRDLGRHRTVSVRAGHRYLARAKRRG